LKIGEGGEKMDFGIKENTTPNDEWCPNWPYGDGLLP